MHGGGATDGLRARLGQADVTHVAGLDHLGDRADRLLDRQEVVDVLRRDAPDVSVSVLEVRPRDVRRLLRARELDLVLARTSDDAPDVESAALRPTPTVLCVPAGHRLAGASPVALKQLDGERLLTWSPPGTAFTDLLLTRLATAGARVEPVESRVTGSAGLSELAERDAVALVPVGYPPFAGIVEVALAEDVTLPLLVLWPTGMPSAAREPIVQLFGWQEPRLSRSSTYVSAESRCRSCKRSRAMGAGGGALGVRGRHCDVRLMPAGAVGSADNRVALFVPC